MTEDLVYVAVFLLLALLVVVPSILVLRPKLVERWTRRLTQPGA